MLTMILSSSPPVKIKEIVLSRHKKTYVLLQLAGLTNTKRQYISRDYSPDNQVYTDHMARETRHKIHIFSDLHFSRLNMFIWSLIN
jgi:hypothetical protein